MKEVTGKAPKKWLGVDVNKSDESRPELRDRLVVQETHRVSTLGPRDAASVLAATLLLEALRFVLSRAIVEMKGDQNRDVVMTFLDISRGYLHSSVRREVFVRACSEDTECPPRHCCKLKAMYGLRDARAANYKKAEAVMESLTELRCLTLACVILSSNVLRVFQYGNDFVALGTRSKKR